MALPDVSISRTNGNLNRVQPTKDNVFGLVLSGAAIAGKIALLEPKALTGSADIVTLGITTVNNPLAYTELLAFYANAKEGTKVWLMLYSDATLLADMCLNTNASGVRKLLDAADGEISGLFINKKLPAGYAISLTTGLDADVLNAAANLQITLTSYGDKNQPLFAILPGLGFAKATAGAVKDLTTASQNRLSIMLGSDSSAGGAAMGRFAGWLAMMPVHHNPARVKYGSVLEAAWFIDGTPVSDLVNSLGDLHDKGYIFFRKITRKSGYFFNDDPTAVSKADDYSSISWNRTINKAHRLAYDVLVDHLNDDVDTDPQTGGISPALASDWEGEVENAITVAMLRSKEISGVQCTIDPTQSSVQTDQVKAVLQIVRKGQSKSIQVAIGYAATV